MKSRVSNYQYFPRFDYSLFVNESFLNILILFPFSVSKMILKSAVPATFSRTKKTCKIISCRFFYAILEAYRKQYAFSNLLLFTWKVISPSDSFIENPYIHFLHRQIVRHFIRKQLRVFQYRFCNQWRKNHFKFNLINIVTLQDQGPLNAQ